MVTMMTTTMMMMMTKTAMINLFCAVQFYTNSILTISTPHTDLQTGWMKVARTSSPPYLIVSMCHRPQRLNGVTTATDFEAVVRARSHRYSDPIQPLGIIIQLLTHINL